MKKYLFLPIPAIALFTGAAFAQDPAKTGNSVAAGNESVIEQIGTSNSANANQSKVGAGSGNYSEIYQGLINNASSGNHATVQQLAASGAKNAARTSQDGNNNTATTLQNTNAFTRFGFVNFRTPFVRFVDNHNMISNVLVHSAWQAVGTFTSTIEQSNNGNTAHVYQGMLLSAATGTAYSAVKQKDASTAVVHQLGGSNNWSDVDQTHSTATVTQTGLNDSKNISALIQTGGARNNTVQLAYGGDNSSYAKQIGGTTNVTQVAFGGANVSGVEQHGGTANIVQNDYGVGQNSSTAWQSGGLVSVTQDIVVAGSNNSDITQTGGSATVDQLALGGRNESIIRSNGGTSSVTQTAGLISNNKSLVIQAGHNFATVDQSANIFGRNISDVSQTLIGSTQNDATVIQTATYGLNISHITQTGSGNAVSVYQH